MIALARNAQQWEFMFHALQNQFAIEKGRRKHYVIADVSGNCNSCAVTP